MSRELSQALVKDPDSTEPVSLDWSAYLAELGSGVQILTSTWAVSGPDALLMAVSATVLSGRVQTQAFLQGGTVGFRYTVTNHIVTNSTVAVVDDRSFKVIVQQR
jgi:hypothetical protein